MKSIWVIARNTFREIIRDRILYGLVIFVALLLGLSLALGQLSFAEQARISMDFGLAGIHLSAVIISIFIGSTLVSREIEKNTILTLLARPISRAQFLVGKFIGLLSVNVVIIFALSLVLLCIVYFLNWHWSRTFYFGVAGVFFEAFVLLSVTFLFGVISKPILTVCFSVGIFLIGHWLNDLLFFAQKSGSGTFKMFSSVIANVLPNLERFNWSSAILYSDSVPLGEFFNVFAYAVSWVVVFLSLAALVFRRRDFV